MVCTVYKKDGTSKKYIKVCSVCKFSYTNKDSLYLQTRNRNCVKEIFIPLEEIDSFRTHESY